MKPNERYEVNSNGTLVIGEPVTLSPTERKQLIERTFSINGWSYNLIKEYSGSHFYIGLKNENLGVEKKLHLYHGNVRKEDPDRNREEKKIQLGSDNDPRQYLDDGIILGYYVYEDKTELKNAIIVASLIISVQRF